MNQSAVDLFACIACGSSLRAEANPSAANNGNIVDGQLTCTGCGKTFPIVRSMPRFVPSEEYAQSFGYQWNRFDRLQLDRHMGNDLSRERFFKTTQWPERMEGQRILEAGCGMGRFTQIALETGAEVFSFDLSNAVEANFKNNGDSPQRAYFSGQHLSGSLAQGIVRQSFLHGRGAALPGRARRVHEPGAILRPGGEIVIDCYQRHTGLFPPLKYWARPFLTWMGPQGVHRFLSWVIPPGVRNQKSAI